jgi:hypothetical protein
MAKGRSPNYPAVDLEAALRRVRELWSKENRHPAAPETIVGHWGYGPKSSGGLQTLAALKQFGLLVDEGRGEQRRARISDLGQSILFHEEGSPGWYADLREAALSPALHASIWLDFNGDLPSDQNLRRHLVVDRGFTEGGAEDFIRELRKTFAFAGLEGSSSRDESGDFIHTGQGEIDDVAEASVLAGAPVRPAADTTRAVQLPYSPVAWATLQAKFPLTEPEWSQMVAVLNAMKPALTAQPDAVGDE